jgi:hypothetical protein
MALTYILMIWTVVGYAGAGTQYSRDYKIERDWRPLGEFHMEEGRTNMKSALQMCEDAAKQLGLKYENYRCVRSK